MNPLTIQQAYKLYQILKPHLVGEIKTGVDFIKVLSESISKSGQLMDMIEIFAILNDTDSDTILKELQPEDASSMLLQGFEVNKLLEMFYFFKRHDK